MTGEVVTDAAVGGGLAADDHTGGEGEHEVGDVAGVAGDSSGLRLMLAEVTDQRLDVDRHRVLVSDPAGGAEVLFCGVVRDHDQGRVVRSLEYVGHPDAGEVIARVGAQIAGEPSVLSVAVSHRVGALSVGDVAFVAAVSCAHRREAFELCARLVDQVKHELPIWKRQVFADGTEEWVNCP
jgi:molybdopterin synthase catalytic subunit